jgi:hypothetical protein
MQGSLSQGRDDFLGEQGQMLSIWRFLIEIVVSHNEVPVLKDGVNKLPASLSLSLTRGVDIQFRAI